MVQITFIEHDGTKHVVNAEKGFSLMETALNNDIPGIDADCGGQCSCATCHVIVQSDQMDRLPSSSDMEVSMLDINPERTDTSRLSCQIPIVDNLEGLVVTLPEFQG